MNLSDLKPLKSSLIVFLFSLEWWFGIPDVLVIHRIEFRRHRTRRAKLTIEIIRKIDGPHRKRFIR